MPFSQELDISAAAVFVQGLLSFFSPCVLPLLPLYLGYLSGTAAREGQAGEGCARWRTAANTLCFVLGVSAAFFLLGLGASAVGRFFSARRQLLAQLGGVLVLLFGLYALGAFGSVAAVERERRLPFTLDGAAMSPLTALGMGFLFSFAWTPCVGPALSSVLLLAASSATSASGFLLIGLYTLGFVLPFLAVSLFASSLLPLLRRHRGVVRWTGKLSGVLLLLVGLAMITGQMDRLSGLAAAQTETVEAPSAAEARDSARPEAGDGQTAADTEDDTQPEAVPAIDFTLTDQYGIQHTLSDYKGRTVFLNFWATWCPPCRAEMPDIQSLYEKYGPAEQSEVVILGVASPDVGAEQDAQGVADFLADNGYTYPVVMDTGGSVAAAYGISALPTTFMIDTSGCIYGYVPGMMTQAVMQRIIDQTVGAAGAED